MATADQIKMLVKAHIDKNEERFKTVVLQMAAYEAKLGHTSFARELRDILMFEKNKKIQVVPFNKELLELINATIEEKYLSELVVGKEIKGRINRVLNEYRSQDKLKKYGLVNRRKILFSGPPGTGKTMTASIISSELHLPLCTIMTDKLVTKYMGETSAKLRLIFDAIQDNPAVYFFDEFDAIGSERSLENDVGEIRRVLNSFLQFIEQDKSTSLIIAATNNPQLLDHALFRRFDDVIHYKIPEGMEIQKLIFNRLGEFVPDNLNLDEVLSRSQNLSHAEVSKACDDAIKVAILSDKLLVDENLLLQMISEKQEAYM